MSSTEVLEHSEGAPLSCYRVVSLQDGRSALGCLRRCLLHVLWDRYAVSCVWAHSVRNRLQAGRSLLLCQLLLVLVQIAKDFIVSEGLPLSGLLACGAADRRDGREAGGRQVCGGRHPLVLSGEFD
jgi:hypothetical protein